MDKLKNLKIDLLVMVLIIGITIAVYGEFMLLRALGAALIITSIILILKLNTQKDTKAE